MKSVFISSTFKDMQAERDYFHERVFPRLQRAIAPLGENIQELDLRWGVDTSHMTEEESGKQVLKVCIDAIDRCKPYTVVLLGERYGWIPGFSVVKETRDSRVDSHYQTGMSITNLEIRYAALDDPELFKRCIFCFRSPSLLEKMEEADRSLYAAESPLHRESLERLKEEIRRHPDAKIVEYEADWDSAAHQVTGVETLGEQIYELLLQMLQAQMQGQTPRSPEEQTDVETRFLMERYLSSYIQRRPEEYAVLHQALEYQITTRSTFAKKHSDIFLCGEAGSGKSALMAACAHRLLENGERVLLYFCGAPGCQSLRMLKRMLVYKLEQFLALPVGSTAGTLEERLEDLNGRLGERQVFCFLDGVDQLFPQGAELYLDVLGLCPHICFILSAVPEYPVEELLRKAARSCKRVEIGGLEAFQVRELVDATTKRRGKKLDDELIEAIVAKKGAHNPLYLSLVLQRFFMMDGREFQQAEALAPGMEGLHLYMERLLFAMPEEPEALILSLLAETGERFSESGFEGILALLAASESGLTEGELEALLTLEGRPFSQLRFQQIASYLYDAFDLSEHGKWDFSHRLFREALLSQPGAPKARRLLARYALADEGFLEREGFAYVLEERLSEGVRVLEKAGRFADAGPLCECVARLLRQGAEDYFSAMLDGEVSEELMDFWLTAFPGKNYGTLCREIQGRFVRKLLEKGGCSPRQEARGWRRLAEEAVDAGSFSEAELFAERGEKAIASLSEPEKSLLLAELLFYRGEVVFGQGKDEDGLSFLKKAGALLEPEALYGEDAFREEAVFWRNRLVCACITETLRQKKELCSQKLEDECNFLEKERPRLSGGLYAACRLRLLSAWIYLFRKSGLSNEQKRSSAEALVQEARQLTDRQPSVDNLRRMLQILYDVYSFTEKRKRYRVALELVGYARRCLERSGADSDAKELMDALFFYAADADEVLVGRPTLEEEKAIGKTSAACWEEGFALLESLKRSGFPMDPYGLAYFHEFYCKCRMELDIDEACYPAIIGHAEEVVRLYEEARDQIKPKDLSSWLFRVRDAHQMAGTLYQKLHENAPAVSHLRASLECAVELSQIELTSDRLLKQMEIQKLLMAALYQARQDEAALKAADELEQLLITYQVTGGEDMWFWISYVRGRLAFERGELAAARREAEEIEEKYGQLLTGTLLGDQCLLLRLDAAMADGDFAKAEAAWRTAETHLKSLRANKHMREHMPCMSAKVRRYLEYGYERYDSLRGRMGSPLSEEEQKEWLSALDEPPVDRLAARLAQNDAAEREKRSEQEKAREPWREAWMAKWTDFSDVLEKGSLDALLLYQDFYSKFIAEDPVYTLPYALRSERRELARELYRRTGDREYIRSYLTETDRLATETAEGSTHYKGGSVRIYEQDPGIHIFDREKEWDRLAWELVRGLYEETGDKCWLAWGLSYLELTEKRRNLSLLSWYEEVFAYIKPRLPENDDYLATLRQKRYDREFTSLMLEFRVSRVKIG